MLIDCFTSNHDLQRTGNGALFADGFLNASLGVGDLNLDALALFFAGLDVGGPQPSIGNKRLINQLFKGLNDSAQNRKEAYLSVRNYTTDIDSNTGLVPFDSLHYNNPSLPRIAQNGTVNKYAKLGGYGQPGNSGYLLTNILIDTSLTINQTDLGVVWVIDSVQNVGNTYMGAAIGSDSRSIAVYPKYNSTNGWMNMAGRSFDFAVPNGLNIYAVETSGTTVRGYLNNVLLGSNTTNHQTAFNTNMIDLAVNTNAAGGVTVGGSRVPEPVRLLMCIFYRPSMISLTTLYNSVNKYVTDFKNL